MVRPPSRLRFPLIALAMATLLAGIWAGLVRLGWNWPAIQPALPLAHGPLMVSGFLGTLIAVERAVALGRRWTYLGPFLSGLGGLLLIAGAPGGIAPLLITLGSLGLAAVFAVIVRRHFAIYTLVMAAGAVAWFLGNLFWLFGWPVFHVVLWWAGFLILTIAGERLELGRMARLSEVSQVAFVGAAGVFLTGLVIAFSAYDLGTRWAGAGMLAMALWLLRFDIARRTVRKAGLPRFIAVCLLSGYLWLGIAGALGLVYGGAPAGPLYDALLHAIFLGFVFAMIFGHAPVIFPAVLGAPVSFHRVQYVPLLVLHTSLLTRIGGDLGVHPQFRLWGGLLNGIALLLFLGVTAYSLVRGRRTAQGEGRITKEELPEARLQPAEGVRSKDNNYLHRAWYAALACFVLAGATGALWRFGMLAGLPAGLQFGDLRHAHSHLMYFGWATPALMALLAARLSGITGRPARPGFGLAIGLAIGLALVAYPLFLVYGYDPVAIGSARLPLAVIVSSLNILPWYAFAGTYMKATWGVRREVTLRLWDLALVFLALASLGAWGRAILAGLQVSDPFWTGAMVHLFLDLFSEGWFVLALLGLAHVALGKIPKQRVAWEARGRRMICLGLPFTFLLGMPVFLVPPGLRSLAGLGGVLVGLGTLVYVRVLWQSAPPGWRAVWGLPLSFLSIKAIAQMGTSLPTVATWGERLGLRLPYLHILLLGFVSLGLFVAAGQVWGGRLVSGRRWMAPAILALLASLFPFTGLWPAGWAGLWTVVVAAWASLLPVLVALVLLFSGWAPGKILLPPSAAQRSSNAHSHHHIR